MGSPEKNQPPQFFPTTPQEEEEANLYAAQLVSASVLPMILKAAIELDVLEMITKEAGFLSPEAITLKLGTTNPEAPQMLDRMLRLLASYKILTYRLDTDPNNGDVTRSYGPAPVCKYLTKNEDGATLSAICSIFQDKLFMESWYHLKDAVMEGGIPFNKVRGMTPFEYRGKDMRYNKLFNEGMSNHSTIIMKKILSTYMGFKGLKTLVDVGGGSGAALNLIINKYPEIKGINFDLTHVIANAPSIPGMIGILNCESSVGRGACEWGHVQMCSHRGCHLRKWILHDWSDEQCLILLKNCYKALPDDGKMIIVEGLLPVAPETTLANQALIHMDIIMLVNNHGKERTKGEYESLAKKAGFSGFAIACSLVDFSVLEFTK